MRADIDQTYSNYYIRGVNKHSSMISVFLRILSLEHNRSRNRIENAKLAILLVQNLHSRKQ